ncbi:MAG: putative DNA binding domain-containing protein [Clostridiales bacterium]|jgi:ATP-dependent DNA helicase RecG|nr:putative DNA binding domain-containing protein [Clostridiales bacterium]
MALGFENERLEFKNTVAELSEACVSIAAILNKHKQGVLYFGVANEGKVIGHQIGKETTRDISRRIYERVKPVPYFEVETIEVEGKTVIKVTFDGKETPYSADGRYYVRSADEDKAITQTQLFTLVRSQSPTYEDWENTLTEYTADDVDEEILLAAYKDGMEVKRLTEPYGDKETVLGKFNLLRSGRLTNAGVVLFSKRKPVTLKLALFATDERITILDQEHFKGNIYECIKAGRLFVHKHMRWRAEITGEIRRDIPEVPVDAIREIVINSFAHSRYEHVVTAHEIDVYPRRIDIFNPGNLPETVNPEEYAGGKLKSVLKNPAIADVLYKTNRIEEYGTGFRKVFSLCSEAEVKVTYSDDVQGFTFEFGRIPLTAEYGSSALDGLDDMEIAIYKLLKKNDKITADEIASKIAKTMRTAYRGIASLKEKGFVKRVGGAKGRWVVLK